MAEDVDCIDVEARAREAEEREQKRLKEAEEQRRRAVYARQRQQAEQERAYRRLKGAAAGLILGGVGVEIGLGLPMAIAGSPGGFIGISVIAALIAVPGIILAADVESQWRRTGRIAVAPLPPLPALWVAPHGPEGPAVILGIVGVW